MKNSVAYLRRSTVLQDQSISDQEKAVNQYAEQNDYKILNCFIDDGISGTSTEKRDAFKNMIDIVENGSSDFDYILCYDISRWGRFPDSDESGYWEFHCQRFNVEVIYTNEPGLSENRLANSVIKSVKRSAAGDFSRSLSKVVVRGMQTTAENGYWNGSAAPLGYKRAILKSDGLIDRIMEKGEKKSLKNQKVKLVPGDPFEIKIVNLIFDLYLNRNLGITLIARYLNERGIKSPNDGKVRKFSNNNGGTIERKNQGVWQNTSVINVLKNTTYIGHSSWGKQKRGHFTKSENTWNDVGDSKQYHDENKWTIVKNTHEPIVDEKIFNQVQILIKERKQYMKTHGGKPYGSRYLLTGMMYCKNCKNDFIGHTKKRPQKTYYYYIDKGSANFGVELCKNIYIPQNKVEDFAIKKIKDRLHSEFWKEKLKNRLMQKIQIKEVDNANYDEQINILQIEIDNLLDVIAVSGLSDQLKVKIAERQNKLDYLKELTAKQYKEKNTIIGPDAQFENYLKVLTNMDLIFDEATYDEQKKIVRTFIESIWVNKEKKEVSFNFYTTPQLQNEFDALPTFRETGIDVNHKSKDIEIEVLEF